MHIPDGFLSNPVCAATTAASIVSLAGAAAVARRKSDAPLGSLAAIVGAGIFAGQMVNFPVADGTSGHLIGALVAALLGPCRAMLALVAVLVVQCLLFGDGGLSALGANVLNMAVIGVLTSMVVLQVGRRFGVPRLGAVAIAAWVSVMAAASMCAVELAASGTQPLGVVLLAMLKVHSVIGLGEAAITTGILALCWSSRIETGWQRLLVGMSVVTAIALLLSPWASGAPDGLERVAAMLRFEASSVSWYAAPLPDYGSAQIATMVAGALGVAVVGCTIFAFDRLQLIRVGRRDRDA